MTAPTVEQLAEAQQLRLQRLARAAVDRADERWSVLDPDDLSGSWAAEVPGVVQVVTAAQVVAAAHAEDYLTAAAGNGPRLNPLAFAGAAADGRSLATLFSLPAITAKQSIAAGLTVEEALGRGRAQLLLGVQTEVADAARVATGVGITARPRIAGYARVVSLPACDRCVLLAGRVYRWSQGFQRHPRCDCSMAPAGSGEADMAPDPKDLFAKMTPAEQDASFGKAGARAVRDGADIGRVVNAKRGMYEAGDRQFTTEATTRRGRLDGQADGRRPTPKQIYTDAGDDRGEAIRLLQRFGYIT